LEHFVVAERQGKTAARNMLGYRGRFDAVWRGGKTLAVATIHRDQEALRAEVEFGRSIAP
jgi:hypothetical protein